MSSFTLALPLVTTSSNDPYWKWVMLHNDRVWCVSEVGSAEELAKNLAETTWCCCETFRIVGHPRYIWLNDSTLEDGAQEYAVCRVGLAKGDYRQI